jgi:hypothetical protein
MVSQGPGKTTSLCNPWFYSFIFTHSTVQPTLFKIIRPEWPNNSATGKKIPSIRKNNIYPWAFQPFQNQNRDIRNLRNILSSLSFGVHSIIKIL